MTDAAGPFPSTTMLETNRKTLAEAVDLIDRAKALLDQVRDSEEGALGELPESTWASAEGQARQDAVNAIDEKIDALDSMRADLFLISSREADSAG